MIKHMEYAYSIRSINKLKEYNLFLETHKSKIAAYIDFIQNSYGVKDLPEYIVFADFDMATRVHSSISIPAYTNEIRMVITPELNIWKSIYLKQLEVYELKAVENIQSYYSNDINENSILQIIGHELMHQSELFLDDFEDEKKLTEGIWFEEGMVEYISKKFFLTTEEFEKEKQINTSLVKLFEEKYGISSIESFGQETYDENYTSIFYNYWRSFLAIDILVQKFHIVSKVFEHYHNWNKAGRTMPLSKWFQIE